MRQPSGSHSTVRTRKCGFVGVDGKPIARRTINTCNVLIIDFIQPNSPGLKHANQRVGSGACWTVVEHLCGLFSRFFLRLSASLNGMPRMEMYVTVVTIAHSHGPSKLNRGSTSYRGLLNQEAV